MAALVIEFIIYNLAKVVELDPGLKGDTSQGGTKQGTVEASAVINVLLFVDRGQEIVVDIRTGYFLFFNTETGNHQLQPEILCSCSGPSNSALDKIVLRLLLTGLNGHHSFGVVSMGDMVIGKMGRLDRLGDGSKRFICHADKGAKLTDSHHVNQHMLLCYLLSSKSTLVGVRVAGQILVQVRLARLVLHYFSILASWSFLVTSWQVLFLTLLAVSYLEYQLLYDFLQAFVMKMTLGTFLKLFGSSQCTSFIWSCIYGLPATPKIRNLARHGDMLASALRKKS
ncbi:hypothetical protein CTI12_AA082300 [Artemisia annua]|uniref:Elongation factor P C-terminal domain-containing protein n=1 Tax=Artemisia annua TaxID=35608 RepID=A0A2U1Q2D6_ARTAN|nr:hypothetical protein CTI12_AA082300 [Artemisia annua]